MRPRRTDRSRTLRRCIFRTHPLELLQPHSKELLVSRPRQGDRTSVQSLTIHHFTRALRQPRHLRRQLLCPMLLTVRFPKSLTRCLSPNLGCSPTRPQRLCPTQSRAKRVTKTSLCPLTPRRRAPPLLYPLTIYPQLTPRICCPLTERAAATPPRKAALDIWALSSLV